MALQKQIIDIPLQGLDTGTDARLVPLGKMLTLKHGSFRVKGSIRPRFGSEDAGGSATGVNRLYGFGGQLFKAAVNGVVDEFRTYNAATAAESTLGTMALPEVFVQNVTGGIGTAMGSFSALTKRWLVDSCVLSSSLVAFVALKTAGVEVTWIDTSTDRIVAVYQTGIGTSGVDNVRVLGVGGKPVFAVCDAAAETIKIYEVTSTTAVSLRATLSSFSLSFGGDFGWWDWAVTSNGSTIAVAGVDGADILLYTVATSGWATASATWTPGANVGAVGVGASTDINVFWDDDTGLQTRTYTTALVNSLGTTAVVAGAAERRTIAVNSRSNGTCDVAWSETSSGQARIEYVLSSAAGVASGATTTRGSSLGSKLLYESTSGRVFCLGLHGSKSVIGPTGAAAQLEAQTTAYVIEPNKSPATKGRLLYGVANQPAHFNSQTDTLPNIHGYGSSVNNFATATQRRDFEASDGQSSGVLVRMTIDKTKGWHGVESDGHFLVTGGHLQSFDGAVFRENGFLVAPAITACGNVGGGLLADATYTFAVLYERMDAQGRIIESYKSPSVAFALSGGGGTGAVRLAATSYRTGTDTNAKDRMTLYMSVGGGTLLYRQQSIANDRGADTVQFADVQVLTGLTSNKQIYTSGGEAENAQPDCPITICADKDRAWIVSGNDRLRVDPSKPTIGNRGIAWFSDVGKAVAAADGYLTGLSRMDGKTFAHKKTVTFVSAGDGPDIKGEADTMSEFDLLTRSVGATDQRSIVVGDAGIYLRGDKGIWLIDRSLQPSYVGEDVLAYNGTTVADSCFLPLQNELRFLLSDGKELFYHEQARAWSINTNLQATCMAVVNGRRHFRGASSFPAGDDGYQSADGIYKETIASSSVPFQDAHRGAVPPLTYVVEIQTGWIKLGSLQGFGRVFRALVLGEALGATWAVEMRNYFDYISTEVAGRFITGTGSGSPAADRGTLAEMPFSTQKCEAVSVKLRFNSSHEINVSGFSLEVGMYPGAKRVQSTRRVV